MCDKKYSGWQYYYYAPKDGWKSIPCRLYLLAGLHRSGIESAALEVSLLPPKEVARELPQLSEKLQIDYLWP